MTGPWLVRSLSGFALLNAAPALGCTRFVALVSVPTQAVFAVEKKSMNFVWLSVHGAVPVLLPGAFTKLRTAIGSRLPRNETRARASICWLVKPAARPKV